jgi:hypothetical protein
VERGVELAGEGASRLILTVIDAAAAAFITEVLADEFMWDEDDKGVEAELPRSGSIFPLLFLPLT